MTLSSYLCEIRLGEVEKEKALHNVFVSVSGMKNHNKIEFQTCLVFPLSLKIDLLIFFSLHDFFHLLPVSLFSSIFYKTMLTSLSLRVLNCFRYGKQVVRSISYSCVCKVSKS